ncbi:hypothetical protein [Kocuria sabuli]|uniref:hypothetical protein n=1 Tax=Kocuria sabuli TaxID=3071448 RepID=UPI0034D60425
MSYPMKSPTPAPRKKRVWPWVLASIGGVVVLGFTFVLGVIVGSLGGASSSVDQTAALEAEEGAVTNASPSPSLDFSDVETGEHTERGTLPMKPGATAVASAPGYGELATMTVKSIEVDPVCTGSYIRDPQNGHFVVMDVSVEVSPHSTLADAGVLYDSVSMRQGGFRTVDKDGTVTPGNDIIGNGYGCLPEGSAIATDVHAGEKAEGTLIFDVPTPEGVIILPDLLGQSPGTQGWEWAYPAE